MAEKDVPRKRTVVPRRFGALFVEIVPGHVTYWLHTNLAEASLL